MKGKSKFIDIFVWEIESKKVLQKINGFHLRAVQHVKFSKGGEFLITIGQDDDNSVAVYDWRKGRLISTSKVDKSNVLQVDSLSDSEFLTVGSRHIKEWVIKGASLTGKKINFVSNNKAEFAISCCAGESVYLVGTSQGQIGVCKGGL